MKKAIGAILLVLILVAAAPLLTGGMAKQRLQSELALVDQLPGYFAQIETYRRGWFGATAKIRLGVDQESLANLPQRLPLQQQQILQKILADGVVLDVAIVHGPLFVKGGFGVGWMRTSGQLNLDDWPGAKKRLEITEVDALLSYRTTTNLFGDTAFHASSPAFDVQARNSQNTRFNFAGMQLDGSYKTGSGAVSLRFTSPGFSFVRTYENSQLQREPDISIDDIGIDLRAQQDGDQTVKINTVYTVGKILAEGNTLDDIRLAFAIERLGIDALKHYCAWYKGLSYNPNESSEETQQAFTELANRFLQHSPSLTISDLRFRYNGEPFKADLRADIDGEGLEARRGLNATDVLMRLELNATAQASEKLAREIGRQYLVKLWMKSRLAQSVSERDIKQMAARQVGTLLEFQVQKGKLLRTKTGYQATLVLEDGELTLNGKPIQIEVGSQKLEVGTDKG